MSDPQVASAHQLAAAIARRERSPVEVAHTAIAAIERLDPALNAFLSYGAERLLADARRAERRAAAGGDLPPLLGVPVAVKDMEATEDYPTTRGSLVYRKHYGGVDAAHVARLRAAGALVVGKTNTPEFALLGETCNRLGADGRNPWDPHRTPGGSSGGSAAAVTAGIVPLATGTDTGGSITIPAAYCGVFGFKPTHRRIPVWPNAEEWPLVYDTGPIARTVDDAALALTAMGGADARDPGSVRAPAALPPNAERPWRIAFTESMAEQPVEAEWRAAVRQLAAVCERLGHTIEPAAPRCGTPAAALGMIGAVEEYRYRGHLLAQRDYLEPSTVALMEQGRHTDAGTYAQALADVRAVQTAFDRFFEAHDLLLAPAAACAPFSLRTPPTRIDGTAVEPDWTTFAPFSLFANATGGPLASVPVTPDAAGLPRGVLIFGPVGSDERVLALARALEAETLWQDRWPPVRADQRDQSSA